LTGFVNRDGWLRFVGFAVDWESRMELKHIGSASVTTAKKKI
jgi:hypothetical protein